ncbi:carbon-nitrogen hydrolase family protein [Chromohalobacter sp. HP20-39]|uniref:carbon-nitrogen hydrolase family protein n=1 Tax=Chromohalobacter sp. HP20-39 TaxID=3079306 RepID=UPI00294AEB4B|nr:carbon-nitrogen hydrolase family protein [Chromohalobacter sp. HP20-39]MDV6318002.1 carbon-nitrogen hydrolase family protein [Chromohalobacter sp. HP20-39]
MKITAVQTGPYTGSKNEQIRMLLEQGRKAISQETDLLIFPELISTPYIALEKDKKWLDLAEKIPSATTQALNQLAKEGGCHVTGSIFQELDGKYFNTAVLAKPNGGLGESYSKTHIPNICHGKTRGMESFYFSPGDRFVLWNIKEATIGILICYDRSFPESWRELRLRGADIVVVLASSSGLRSKMFIQELQVRALENGVWVVAVNKGGNENYIDNENPADFYGSSCVISPDGEVMILLDRAPNQTFNYEIDLGGLEASRAKLDYFTARRPDLYKNINKILNS